MKRFLKWFFIVVAGVIGLLLVVILIVYLVGQSRINGTYEVAAHSIPELPPDSTVLARGAHLATISFCHECHGERFEGRTLVDDGAFGLIAASNLTAGEGGVGGEYDTDDFERAIRHGVASDGRMILAMASNYFHRYSDDDIAALIAYVKSARPVDNAVPERQMGPIAKLLVGAGQYVPAVLSIDHEEAHVPAPPVGPTAAYGEYLSQITHCGDCHGPDLKGQTIEGPPPGPDITQTGNPGQWTDTDFYTVLRTGSTPDGRVLDPSIMPWPQLATLTDTEMQAIWVYLKTLE